MECFGNLWSQEVFNVSHGSMSVFHDSRLVFMAFHFQVGLNPEPEARSERLGTPQKIPA